MYTYSNLPVNAIVRLPHPRSGDSQGRIIRAGLSGSKKFVRKKVMIFVI